MKSMAHRRRGAVAGSGRTRMPARRFLRALLRTASPIQLVEPVHALQAVLPTLSAQQRVDPAIAVARPGSRQVLHTLAQRGRIALAVAAVVVGAALMPDE